MTENTLNFASAEEMINYLSEKDANGNYVRRFVNHNMQIYTFAKLKFQRQDRPSDAHTSYKYTIENKDDGTFIIKTDFNVFTNLNEHIIEICKTQLSTAGMIAGAPKGHTYINLRSTEHPETIIFQLSH